MSDLVEREAVLAKKIYMETEEGWSGYTVNADYIEQLPSVTRQTEITLESAIDYLHKIGWMQEHDRILSERQTGEWIEQDNGNMLTYHRYKCSVCGGKRTDKTGDWIQIHDCKWRFCPDCGADMRGANNAL